MVESLTGADTQVPRAYKQFPYKENRPEDEWEVVRDSRVLCGESMGICTEMEGDAVRMGVGSVSPVQSGGGGHPSSFSRSVSA